MRPFTSRAAAGLATLALAAALVGVVALTLGGASQPTLALEKAEPVNPGGCCCPQGIAGADICDALCTPAGDGPSPCLASQILLTNCTNPNCGESGPSPTRAAIARSSARYNVAANCPTWLYTLALSNTGMQENGICGFGNTLGELSFAAPLALAITFGEDLEDSKKSNLTCCFVGSMGEPQIAGTAPSGTSTIVYDDKSQLNFANALGSAFTPFTFNAPTYVTSTCKQAQAVAEYTATFFPPSASYCTSKDIPSETLFMSQLGPAMPPSSPPPPPASPTVS